MTQIKINKNTTARQLLKKIEKQGITFPLKMAYLPQASLEGDYLDLDKVYLNGSYLNKDELISLLLAHRVKIIEE